MRIVNATMLLAVLCQTALAAPADEQAQKVLGKRVFDQWCASCHAAGPRMPGTASLAAKYGDSMPAALEERDNLSPALVQHFVRNGVLMMPPFRKTEITDAELDALGIYLTRTPPR